MAGQYDDVMADSSHRQPGMRCHFGCKPERQTPNGHDTRLSDARERLTLACFKELLLFTVQNSRVKVTHDEIFSGRAAVHIWESVKLMRHRRSSSRLLKAKTLLPPAKPLALHQFDSVRSQAFIGP
jgi:hypothetical protein